MSSQSTQTSPPRNAVGDTPMGLDDNVYQRLLRERIVWLGSEVRDENANAICSKLLLLAAEDPDKVGSSRVDLQACKLEYSIVSPK